MKPLNWTPGEPIEEHGAVVVELESEIGPLVAHFTGWRPKPKISLITRKIAELDGERRLLEGRRAQLAADAVMGRAPG